MPYASNNNAILINDCNDLQDLSVLLEVTEDVATTDGKGWSFQLNCYPPVGEYCQTSQVNWMQYIVYVGGGSLRYQIQYWSYGTGSWPSGYTPQPGTSPWLPCWANDFNVSAPFASITGDTLPSESQLQIALGTNESGGVTKVTFTYTDPDGTGHSAEFDPPAVHPVVACELNLVGPGNFANANFTQGIANSRGIIYYSVSSGQLSVQSGGPGAACGETPVITGETSDMTYSDINGAPGSTVTQILQQPVSCVVDGIVGGGNQGQLSGMRRIRDTQVAQHPAGQWLIELLDRHSADLAVLIGPDQSDRARTARDLLDEATRTVGSGGAFDSATIDEALRFLGQVSCDLPPSMAEAGKAGAAVLEALRGRTLENGLSVASTTILPRFQHPQVREPEK
jgi:hypothetical protein